MKTFISLLVVCICTIHVYSQSDYESAMHAGLDSLNHIKSLEDFQLVANYFERIAGAEKDQWLPGYYASYCYVILSFKEKATAKKEMLLDKAQKIVNAIITIKPEESEIYTLQGMLYQSFISVDPQNNAPVYSMKANQSFDTAISLNPDNPRPYSLKAMNLMYTPEAYGGGMKTACPLFEKADTLFRQHANENDLMPDWGMDYNTQLLGKCGE